MPKLVDNLIAFRILYLLVTPFHRTDAFKLGIIDRDGKLLKSVDDLNSEEEKEAYSYLHRLVFNLKRLIGKVPGGKSMLGSLVAAYFLIKEGIEQGDLNRLEERFEELLSEMDKGLVLVEEQLLVEKFICLMHDEIDMLNEEGAPAVSGGSGVAMGSAGAATGATTIAGRDGSIGSVKKRNNWKNLPSAFGAKVFEVSGKAFNGYKSAKAKGERWNNHLVPSDDDGDKATYDKIRQYSKVYGNKPILIKHRGQDAYQYIK